MAKVKITGHASGTGVLTVTAPNTSTDRTITLPDSTATIATTTDVAARLPSITDGGNATAITIDSSENVGIGTTTPAQKLSLNTGYVQVGNGIGGGGGVKYPYSSANADCRNWRTRSDMQEYGDWGIEQSTTQSGETYSHKFKITQAGDAIVNTGDLIFGTANKGIVLGATTNVDANTLDDYEEGTWTPASTSYGSLTVYSAKYTKIGRQVTLQVYISAASANSNGVALSGLPFTNASAGWSTGALNYASGNTNHTNPHVRVVENGSDVRLMKNPDTNLIGTEITGHIIFTVTYFVA